MSIKSIACAGAIVAAATVLGATAAGGPVAASTRSNTAATPAATHTAAVQSQAITCDTTSNGKTATFYAGPSASYTYDRVFSAAAAVPGLNDYTPQGIAAWNNWDGKGHDLLLVTEYWTGQRSRVYAIDTATGKTVQSVEIAETHGGGIAVGGGWIWISGAGQSIRKYSPSTMRSAFAHQGSPLYVAQVGTARSVYGASFMSYYGGYIYSGRFNDTGRDKMYRYKIASNGTLTTGTSYQVPTKTQGLIVTGTDFIFSTSYGRTNRGNIYVARRGYSSLDGARLHCFRSPSMNEGMTLHGSTAYLVFESGSWEYRASALNPIVRLHRTSLSTLQNLI